MEIGEVIKTHFLNDRQEQHKDSKYIVTEHIQSTKNEIKKEDERVQEKYLLSTIEKANGKFESKSNELSFSVHEKTKQIVVKVIDKQTKEVIKEIPPEKILDMIANMMEISGLFIDEKR